MSEINDLSIAFQKVKNYENYRFLRSWGLTIITFGFFSLVTDTRFIQYGLFWPNDFSLFFDIILILLLLVIILYNYRSVKITLISRSNVLNKRSIRLSLAMVVMYLLSPRILNYFFTGLWSMILIFIGIRITEVLGTLIAYFILKDSIKVHNFKELLYLTQIFAFFTLMDLILLISIILFMPNFIFGYFFVLYSFVLTTCFALCYIIVGRFSLKKAHAILQSE